MGKFDEFKKIVLDASLELSNAGFLGTKRGTGGNISHRIPGEDLYAITPSSVRYDRLSVDDICLVDGEGKLIEGPYQPSIETILHITVYINRPDANAVIHTHQTYASVLSVLNRTIPPMFEESTVNLGPQVEIIPFGRGGSEQLAENVRRKLSNRCSGYIIQNHGALTLGKNMDAAFLNVELLEKVARIYLLALSVADDVTCLPDYSLEAMMAKRERTKF